MKLLSSLHLRSCTRGLNQSSMVSCERLISRPLDLEPIVSMYISTALRGHSPLSLVGDSLTLDTVKLNWTGILIRTSRITSRSYLLVNTCLYYIVDCLKLVINTNGHRLSNLEVGRSRARRRNCSSSSTLRYRGCTLLRGSVLERNDRLVLLSF